MKLLAKLEGCYFRFSIAAKYIALLEDTRHFYSSCIFVLTNYASTPFSSTTMFGSNMKLLQIISFKFDYLDCDGLCARRLVGYDDVTLLIVVDLAVDNRDDLLELPIIGDFSSSFSLNGSSSSTASTSFTLASFPICFFRTGLYMSPPFLVYGVADI